MAIRPSLDTRSGGAFSEGAETVVPMVAASTKEVSSAPFCCAWNR